jgi:hypothetical protein
MPRKVKDYTGMRFSHLTVISFHERKNNNTYWLCKCDCGNEKVININGLRNGTIKACGCLRGGKPKNNNVNKKIYKRWWHMISRCENEKDISYKNYGARGINVCEEWHDFDSFYEWAIKNGYKDYLELDRIDTNGNYTPNNCRFITRLENSRNKRSSLKYEINGEVKPLKVIAEENNIEYKLLWQRINRDGLTLQEAVEVKEI